MKSNNKSEDVVLALEVFKTDTSWEHQERAIYTVESMEKEIRALLSPKQAATEEKTSS